MNVFAARIVNLRKARGLTQEQFAEALNMSRSIISLVEAGMRNPSKEMAKRMSQFFKVPVEMFLFEEDVQKPEETKKMVSMAEIISIAEVVQEFFEKNGYQITQEQKVALIDHFYQKHITDTEKIKDMLSLMQAMQFVK